MPLAPQELSTYFITTVTANRRRLFQVEQNANLLIEVLQDERTKNRLQLHAFVVMPDHAHLLLTPSPKSPSKKQCNTSKETFPSA